MSLNEEVVAELAEGTGGTFVHNSNDLKGGLQTLAAAPECVYLLELSLENVKQDGTYHALKVKWISKASSCKPAEATSLRLRQKTRSSFALGVAASLSEAVLQGPRPSFRLISGCEHLLAASTTEPVAVSTFQNPFPYNSRIADNLEINNTRVFLGTLRQSRAFRIAR